MMKTFCENEENNIKKELAYNKRKRSNQKTIVLKSYENKLFFVFMVLFVIFSLGYCFSNEPLIITPRSIHAEDGAGTYWTCNNCGYAENKFYEMTCSNCGQ